MRAIIVGSGAGGATAARELAQKGYETVVLEAGEKIKPFSRKVGWTEPVRRVGLIGREANVTRFIPSYKVDRSSEELVLFRGMAVGGCTVVSCGNLVRADKGLSEIGLDLGDEYSRLEKQIGSDTIPRERWRPTSQAMFRAAEEMGLKPSPTPKAVDMKKCVSCGLCEVGCVTGARWDSTRFLDEAVRAGCTVRSGAPVQRVVLEGNRAVGVQVDAGNGPETIRGDVVVLAAGGIGTAQILRASGIAPSDTLWADIVLTIGGKVEGARQLQEPPMVWFSLQDDYIISPYIDVLSHWFHRPWRSVGLKDRVGVMIKLAEEANGKVLADGTVVKPMEDSDMKKLDAAEEVVSAMMEKAGVKGPYVRGLLHGGHLGGTVPLHKDEVDSMHPSFLPPGLWVADLSLLPQSQGLPTMLTTAALAMRVSEKIA